MITNLSLAWVIGFGPRAKGGRQSPAEWRRVLEVLEEVRVHAGSVSLSVVNGPDSGPDTLQVFAENDFFLLTLGEITADDYHVRSFTNKHASNKYIFICGDRWSDSLVCSDFNVIRQTFDDFFNAGDVSHELLS